MRTFKHAVMTRSICYVLHTGYMLFTGFDLILERSIAIIAIVCLAHCRV